MTTPPGLPSSMSLTTEDVLRIADDVNRGPRQEAAVISWAYHLLSVELAGRIGQVDNNWYCYASWTSRAIGESLDLRRKSQFLIQLRAILHIPPQAGLPFRYVIRSLLGVSYVKGLQLANRSIFLEMGSFLTELWRDAATPGLKVEPYRFAKPDEFVSKLLDDRAQVSYLEQAARLFRRAASPAITPEERGEIILGANIALSAYEQRRAQKLLELVTYRPVRWIMMIWWRALYYAIRRKPFLHFQIYSRPRDEVSWPVRFMENRWAGFYSRRVLSVQIPDCVIRMGKPLPPPPGVTLADLRRPLQDPEVRELVETFMGSADPADVRGVRNWLSYDERMRFISGYFRTYRGYAKLFGPPYEKEHFCQKLYHEIWEALSPDNAEPDGNDEWGDPPAGARRFLLSPLIDPETNVLASKSVRHLAVPR